MSHNSRRRVWIGTGWKMNKTLAEAERYALRLRQYVEERERGIKIFIVPPFTVLSRVCGLLAGSPVRVGAQNMHWEERGAFTGEISPLMVKDCGAGLVELGHSERRSECGETDFTVNKKVLAALRHGLRPLICVGETAVEKQFGIAREHVVRQIKIALKGVDAEEINNVILAYEPVWAIGDAGTPAEPHYANTMQGWIREGISELYGDDTAHRAPVLYGGSVNLQNAEPLLRQPHIDGLFVGRAAWEVESFIALIETAERTKKG